MAKQQQFNFNWDEVEKEQEELDNTKSSGGGSDDPRFYKVKTDSDGKFISIIRFLPPPKGESVARVPFYNHYFNDKDGWYVEPCPKTIGKKCPVCDHTYEVFTEYGKEISKKKNKGKYQKKQWISNILVIDDKQNPENNGKVFLYKYGVTIKDILDESVKPEDPDVAPIKPFDFYKGADFRLNVYTKKAEGSEMPQYDKCKFRPQSELFDGDYDELAELYEKEMSLEEFNDEKAFGNYDELKRKLDKVLGKEVEDINEDFASKDFNKEEEEKVETKTKTKRKVEVEDDEEEEETPIKEKAKKEKSSVDLNEVEDEDEYFKMLREED